MSAADELLENNHAYAVAAGGTDMSPPPSRRLAVVTCMDARLDLFAMLGIERGEAHIIRNAGGIVTDDVIRSLSISQRLLDTREVMLILHTGCGLMGLSDEEFAAQLEAEAGVRPGWSLGAFSDIEATVRGSVEQIRSSAFIPHRDHVRGFVYEVETGRLREVVSADTRATAPA